MLGEGGTPFAEFEAAARKFLARTERGSIDLAEYRGVIADSMVIDVVMRIRPVHRAVAAGEPAAPIPSPQRPPRRRRDGRATRTVIHWARGGPSNLPNLVLLCFYHHRLVHEGGWQVIKSGREFSFLPPERVFMRRARGPGTRWAA